MTITRPFDQAVSARFARRVCLGGLIAGLVSVLLSGCGGREHASPYAAAVFDDPPIYCYRTIGDVDCFGRPLAGAERRLVNYYGLPPDDYERPEAPPAPLLHPPPPGRAVPESDVAPAVAPATAPVNQPTPLFPADPSPAAEAAAGDDPATVTSSAVPTATVAGTERPLPAAAASAGKPAMASPKPRPRAAPAATPTPDTEPLVIEVEDR